MLPPDKIPQFLLFLRVMPPESRLLSHLLIFRKRNNHRL